MDNLIRNPNITSSHLFRADIYYDSDKDASYRPSHPRRLGQDLGELTTIEETEGILYRPSSKLRGVGSGNARSQNENDRTLTDFARHMKHDLRPINVQVEDFQMTRTIVRQLVPRNPQRDRPMTQTCHFYEQHDEATDSKSMMVMYVPHLREDEIMPFYHPSVKALAFLHSRQHSKKGPDHSANQPDDISVEEHGRGVVKDTGNISIHLSPFPPTASPQLMSTDPTRLNRTLANLLSTIHRHGTGKHAHNYTKRVHHDRMIPQSRFQNTYTRLKLKYAKGLVSNWQEVTDPTKHVFEDLGIAAFCIELWRTMYSDLPVDTTDSQQQREYDNSENIHRPPFPGFIDLACGNGLLTHILLSEGFSGFGFDARSRRSWSTYPATTSSHLHVRYYIPELFHAILDPATLSTALADLPPALEKIHDGDFIEGRDVADSGKTVSAKRRPFLISNHADQLTLWTPLIAYLAGDAPFLAIPCCSHDFGMRRFRARSQIKQSTADAVNTTRESTMRRQTVHAENRQTNEQTTTKTEEECHHSASITASPDPTSKTPQELKSKATSTPQPSAYASLCSYLSSLTSLLALGPETEILRIPSTRNHCVVSRGHPTSPSTTAPSTPSSEMKEPKATSGVDEDEDEDERRAVVAKILEGEMGMPLHSIASLYLSQLASLFKKPVREGEGGH
ncbi:MAG: tRNA(Ser) Um(44) 2'-O-methyltransferase [Chrysothrix sp. TS-e1954]|nr:MAG: tRNA(Ser) Um(44) 2'-O-methyltransferase [Chrysothrix sp. TS-e1954]